MTEEIGQVAIIGAGPSGIAAGKNCKQTGLDFVIFDQNSAVGGNWLFSEDEGHSSVYEASHIISSKTWSQYEDFPMPADYPDYPSHRQLQRYFADYADHFGVTPHIRFRHYISHVQRRDDGLWQIDYTDAEGAPPQRGLQIPHGRQRPPLGAEHAGVSRYLRRPADALTPVQAS